LWCRAYNIKCVIDLHAAPGSQNGAEHSASRDGTTGWPSSPDYVSKTLDVIDFLASRYISRHAVYYPLPTRFSIVQALNKSINF